MRDYPDLQTKMKEAARWLEHAALQGADLVVFPESMQRYRGDGPENPLALRTEDIAVENFDIVGVRYGAPRRPRECGIGISLSTEYEP